jgi:hypothetical protein
MGPIEGTFNATGTLTLTTSNGPINVDVNLSNDDADTAKLRMHTSNGYAAPSPFSVIPHAHVKF